MGGDPTIRENDLNTENFQECIENFLYIAGFSLRLSVSQVSALLEANLFIAEFKIL